VVKITKRELLYALLGTIIILSWFLYLRDIIAPLLEGLPPIVAMLLFNTGLFFGLYLLSSILDSKATRFKMSFLVLMVFLGIDILAPPYLVLKDGFIVKSIELWFVSTDAAIGSFYQSFSSGYAVFFLTYIVTPILFLFVIPIIVSDPGKIKRVLHL